MGKRVTLLQAAEETVVQEDPHQISTLLTRIFIRDFCPFCHVSRMCKEYINLMFKVSAVLK